MEYFIVLFGIRYDKHWRRAKPKPSTSVTAHNLTTTATGASATTNLSQASENDVSISKLLYTHSIPAEIVCLQFIVSAKIETNSRENRHWSKRPVHFPQWTRLHPKHGPNSQPWPLNGAKKRWSMKQIAYHRRHHHHSVNHRFSGIVDGNGKRTTPTYFSQFRNLMCILFFFLFTCSFRNVAENAILYVGSQHGRLDQLSLVLFPLTFLLFTISYWIIYLNASKHRQSN